MSHNQSKQTSPKQSNSNPVLMLGGVLVFILALAAIFFLSRGGEDKTALPAEINVEKALAMREAGAFILDVRTLEEWNEFHVPDSTLIPLDQLTSRLGEVPQDQEVVVVCRSGNRSQQGRDVLLQAGFTKVTSMAGGLNEWRKAGYPTATGR
jgi:rhodanese-related sulfurtransferase